MTVFEKGLIMIIACDMLVIIHYGYRTRATVSDDALWYDANALIAPCRHRQHWHRTLRPSLEKTSMTMNERIRRLRHPERSEGSQIDVIPLGDPSLRSG